MKDHYIAIAIACRDCGGDMAVRVFPHLPTQTEVLSLKHELGGMMCIRTEVERVPELGEMRIIKRSD